MAIIATALVLATLVGSSQDSAEAIDPADTDTVYIADGTNFADALMGATIAALNTSPMLGVAGTNGGDVIPDDTAEELDRLTDNKSDLLDTIYIFGGDQAVSDDVANQLGAWANDVQRIAGDSRWGTYEAISQMLPSMIDEAAHAQEADHATEADNADTLDGNDSTDFLGATEKAADSELLDGKDSSAFASDMAPVLFEHATAASEDVLITTDTTLVELTVDVPDPCGGGTTLSQFLLEANTTMYLAGSDGDYRFWAGDIKLDSTSTIANDSYGTAYAETAIAQAGQGFDANGLSPFRLFDDVSPGSHTFTFIIDERSGNADPEAKYGQLKATRTAYVCSGSTASSASAFSAQTNSETPGS